MNMGQSQMQPAKKPQNRQVHRFEELVQEVCLSSRLAVARLLQFTVRRGYGATSQVSS